METRREKHEKPSILSYLESNKIATPRSVFNFLKMSETQKYKKIRGMVSQTNRRVECW